MRPFTRRRGVLNIAHRGGAGERPESTLLAFRHALEAGSDLLELDVHLTADATLIVCHDADLFRIAGEKLLVSQLSTAEIQSIDAGANWVAPDAPEGSEPPYRGAGLYLPTLEELFSALPEAQINVDIKVEDPRAATETARLIRSFRREERTAVASFLPGQLRRFRRLAPEIVTSAHPGDVRLFFAMSRLGVAGFLGNRVAYLQIPEYHGNLRLLDRRFLLQAHRAGREVHVWTVNEPGEMRRLVDLGVDGIVTDYPSRLTAILEGGGKGRTGEQ
ncbi:MAG: glycerophosphodiester phosphodiesterase [Alkalispirochaetaceae bacterium]